MSYLIILIFLLAPTYSVRFNLNGLPTNLLMISTFVVWFFLVVIIIKNRQVLEYLKFKKHLPRPLLLSIFLFFFAGLVSLFVQGYSQEKLGQFIVLFVQPIGTFFLAAFTFHKQPEKKHDLLLWMYVMVGLAGLLAIYQYFTLHFLPTQYWGNAVEPKRALAFFSHPNFYALFSAPLLALLLPDLAEKFKLKDLSFAAENIICKLLYFLGLLGLLLSLSRAGWLGFAAAIFIYTIIAGDKYFKRGLLALVVVLIIIALSLPNLRYRLFLPFMGEKSSISRLSLWHTGSTAIQEAPILGLGLTGFSQNWERLNTDQNLDKHNFPHNILLDFWTETGLLGVLGMFGVLTWAVWRGLQSRSNTFKLGVALFFITLITQGLIDNPYFKNDLALVFWLVLSLTL